MSRALVFLSIPGLRVEDLPRLPGLRDVIGGVPPKRLHHSFPCVTWPSQATMLTGRPPSEHGVTANGFFWRDESRVEMWTAWNERIQAPQIWDLLHQRDAGIQSGAWFPMLSKGCGADFICMPAPIHRPDGSEDLWCYTRPQEYYGDLLKQLGHFPLQHFWGPLANIKSTEWICQSASLAAERFAPRFFYLYLPHLDYASQKNGPDSEAARQALTDLDRVLVELIGGFKKAYSGSDPLWVIASEYVITPVNHVTFPNRVLRDAGLLTVVPEPANSAGTGGELIDFASTPAWALVDHQFAHVYVRGAEPATCERVAALFRGADGIAEVLVGEERSKYAMDHERSGEVILISTDTSWQAYYWWRDDQLAPSFARTVDIHRKPGYDPVELHFDPASRSIPLDASLIRGSHGAPARRAEQQGVLLVSSDGETLGSEVRDTEICPWVLERFE